jgi:hypothetical protein
MIVTAEPALEQALGRPDGQPPNQPNSRYQTRLARSPATHYDTAQDRSVSWSDLARGKSSCQGDVIRALARCIVLAVCACVPSIVLAQQDVLIPWQAAWLKEFNEGNTDGEIAAKLFRPAGDAPALVFDKYRVREHPASRDGARERVAQWIDAVLKT